MKELAHLAQDNEILVHRIDGTPYNLCNEEAAIEAVVEFLKCEGGKPLPGCNPESSKQLADVSSEDDIKMGIYSIIEYANTFESVSKVSKPVSSIPTCSLFLCFVYQ